MWILKHAFFAEFFQPMNAAVTFQIGLNDSARAIRGKFTFAGAWESFQGIRTVYNGKWYVYVDYSVFTGMFLLKLCLHEFKEHILRTQVHKDAVPRLVTPFCTRWKAVPSKKDPMVAVT